MARSNHTHTHRDVGLLGHAFWLVIKLVFWSLLGWFMALLISTLLLTTSDNGLSYLHQLIASQLRSLGTRPILLSKAPAQTAQQTIHVISQTLFVKTQVLDWLNQNFIPSKTVKAYLGFSYAWLADYGKAWILTTQLIVLRLMIATFMLPLCLVLGWIGFVDGLVQRDLRKFSGGRESSLVYHRAKRYILPILMSGIFIYLVLPLPLPPQWIFLPSAVVFGLAIRLTVSRFKKYV